jgi:DNA-binding transcriptional MerR regulator
MVGQPSEFVNESGRARIGASGSPCWGVGVEQRDLIPIGRFAKIVGLSPHALRFYDKHGLLHPVEIDPNNQYRLYGLDQLDTAITIRLLRELEVPLREIAALLTAGQPEIERRLELHRSHIAARRARDDKIVRELDRMLGHDRSALHYDIAVVDVPSMRVISARGSCSSADLDTTIMTLTRHLREAESSVSSERSSREIVLYHDLLRHEPIDVEVCLRVPYEADQTSGSWEMPGGPAVRTLHYGSWDTIYGAYSALLSWVVRGNHDVRGPLREVYLVDERDSDDLGDYVTELTWPVQ